jgi:hypothetical protein
MAGSFFQLLCNLVNIEDKVIVLTNDSILCLTPRPRMPVAVNLRSISEIQKVKKVSPPFEGGVAGIIDYLIVTGLFPGRGG